MFEFAIAQHKKRPPSKRLIYALIASLGVHTLAVFLLIQFPELLTPGRNWWLRPLALISATTPDQGWRMVTILEHNPKMQAPALASIRKYLYDYVDPSLHKGSPPIRIKWGEDKKPSIGNTDQAVAPVRPAPGKQEPKPVPNIAAETQQPPDATSASPSTGSGIAVSGAGTSPTDPLGGRGSAVALPPPQPAGEPREIPKKTVEAAANATPTQIPGGSGAKAAESPNRSTKNAAQANVTPQIFENQQKALQAPGSGLFDTRGFPLGDYAAIIIDRIKGNWYIPSNLRFSAGHTTVIFFIDKDGRYTDAHIVASSGSSSLDLAALNAIIGSNPFPPLPRGFPGDRVGAKFVFSYNERP